MSFVERIGLAITAPRWALAVGGDRRRAGGSGSDLLVLIAIVLLATQARWLVAAGWLAVGVDGALGARAFASVLTSELTVDLGFLVLGAFALYATAGPRRDLGRAFDLACVAALPLLLVDLGANVIAFAGQAEVLPIVGWTLSGFSYGWTGVLLALAVGPARVATARPIAVPPEVTRRAKTVGWVVVAAAVCGLALQVRWVAANLDEVKPMSDGEPAPAFSLPRITDAGGLGAPVTLAEVAGKPVVLDFWATWCGPCLASMPVLDSFTRAHPEVTVLAVNIDNPAVARQLFAKHQYAMQLVAGDDEVTRRYGVSTIPHTVVIDGAGLVRKVGRVGEMDLDTTIAALAK